VPVTARKTQKTWTETMATPMWVRTMLLHRGIPFMELHDPEERYTAQEVARREHFSGHRVAKVVVAMIDGRPTELILPASRRVNLEKVRAVLHAREARLASEGEMEKCFPDCQVGAIPALRHGRDAGVLMDRSLDGQGDILFQAGTHQDAIRLDFRDWYEMVQPQKATFAEPADPGRA
jgi:Ala-tRNA(Pro) deacylase